MLEQPALLLRPCTDGRAAPGGRVWIVDPATGGPLGSAGRGADRDSLGWLPWRPGPPVEVREGDDEPLVFTLRRVWALRPAWWVEDAEGARVGGVRGEQLLDGRGRVVAARRPAAGPGQALYVDVRRRELARAERDAEGIRLVFLPDGEGNPFIKMLLLAAALVHHEAVLGRL